MEGLRGFLTAQGDALEAFDFADAPVDLGAPCGGLWERTPT
jgi:hypothetical protein